MSNTIWKRRVREPESFEELGKKAREEKDGTNVIQLKCDGCKELFWARSINAVFCPVCKNKRRKQNALFGSSGGDKASNNDTSGS